MNTAPVIIKTEHLKKSFGDHEVLCDFNFELYKGENVVVLGRSGSGKSVFIKCIIGLIKPDSGTISVLNTDIGALNHNELDNLRMRIGFLFQSNALYDSMSVRQNLEFPLRRHGLKLDDKQVKKMIAEVLEDVGLSHTAEMMPSELSGGMKKRIALARTLILKPEIILYDEPTTGLDPVTAKEISQLMLQVQAQYNTSSVIISHDMNCVKITANRIVVLLNGKCYATGTYTELKGSTDKNIRQFFEL